jgi:hypothetical protein
VPRSFLVLAVQVSVPSVYFVVLMMLFCKVGGGVAHCRATIPYKHMVLVDGLQICVQSNLLKRDLFKRDFGLSGTFSFSFLTVSP